MLPQPRPTVLAVPTANACENTELSAKLRQLYGGPKPARHVRDRRLRQLAGVVEATPDDWKAIQGAIKATGLSSAYLSVRFKEEAGLPLRSYALWCKFERACALVAQGNNAREAALMAGFSDQSHMGRAARRFAGKSFGQVQQELSALADATSGNMPETTFRPLVGTAHLVGSINSFSGNVTRLRSPHVEYQEPVRKQSGMVGSSSGR